MNEERIHALELQVSGARPDRKAALLAEIAQLRGEKETTTAEPVAERAVKPAAKKRTAKPKE